TRPGPGGQVDGEETARVEVQVDVLGADGLVEQEDVRLGRLADQRVGALDPDDPLRLAALALDPEHHVAVRPERTAGSSARVLHRVALPSSDVRARGS